MNFNLFNDISHRPLRIYNRVVMAHNLLEDSGQDTAKDYLSSFDETERKEMYLMQLSIKALGKERVHKEVTKDLIVEDDYESETIH